MTKENIKNVLIALLWLVMGFICWLAGLYSFSNGIGHLVKPVSLFLLETFHSRIILDISDIILFDGVYIFFAIVFAFALSALMGNKGLRLLIFLLGALGTSIYGIIQVTISDLSIYNALPSSVVSWLIKIIIINVIVIPLLAWAGAIWGHRYYEKRNA